MKDEPKQVSSCCGTRFFLDRDYAEADETWPTCEKCGKHCTPVPVRQSAEEKITPLCDHQPCMCAGRWECHKCGWVLPHSLIPSKPSEPTPTNWEKASERFKGQEPWLTEDPECLDHLKAFIASVEREAEEKIHRQYANQRFIQIIIEEAQAKEREKIVEMVKYQLPKAKIVGAGIDVHAWSLGYKEAIADVLSHLTEEPKAKDARHSCGCRKDWIEEGHRGTCM